MFGLDAMIDEEGRVYLLELNCDPDLKVLCEVNSHPLTHAYARLLHMCASFICVPPSYVCLLHMCASFICVPPSYVCLLHMCVGVSGVHI